MTDSTKLTHLLLSAILVFGVVGMIAIISGTKFVYALSDPISSPTDPSPSPIVSEPITPSPSPELSPSPEASASPEVSPSPTIKPSPEVSPSVVPSPSVMPSPSTEVSPSISPTMTPTPAPVMTFKAEFYNNKKLKGDPVLEMTTQDINFDWGRSAPDPKVDKNFSARFKGMKYFEGGKYKVTTSNDDGLKFYLDGRLVHSAWYDQGALKRSFKMDIPQGNHWVVVDYYNAGGKASAMVTWEKL